MVHVDAEVYTSFEHAWDRIGQQILIWVGLPNSANGQVVFAEWKAKEGQVQLASTDKMTSLIKHGHFFGVSTN